MASREILSLDTATPQIVAPQTGDTYSAPRAVAISPESLTGSAATTSLDIAQTWNTTGTPTAVKLNVTDTASNANSLLMDLQVGGSTKVSITKAGLIYGTGGYYVGLGGGLQSWFANINAVGNVGFGPAFTSDTILTRDNAAYTLAQRNATNPQTFNVYNTYTNSTNYERGFLKWNTNVLQIGTEKGSGGGTARALEFQTDGTTRLAINSAGAVTASNLTSNSYCLVADNNRYSWSSADISIYRDASNAIGIRDGSTPTNAQTFRVYNTYTSLTNRENIRIAAASNVFYIEPEKGSGGGTLRPLVVGHGATTYAALPAASAALEGARAYVSDWTGAATFGTTVNAGGGATKVPVWCDGTNWLVG